MNFVEVMKLLTHNKSLVIQCHLQPNRMPTNETTVDTDRFYAIKEGLRSLIKEIGDRKRDQ